MVNIFVLCINEVIPYANQIEKNKKINVFKDIEYINDRTK